MAEVRQVNVRAHCLNAGKKVCGNLDIEEEPLKVSIPKHACRCHPYTDPHAVWSSSAGVTN